jgi:hypothetical protein
MIVSTVVKGKGIISSDIHVGSERQYINWNVPRMKDGIKRMVDQL